MIHNSQCTRIVDRFNNYIGTCIGTILRIEGTLVDEGSIGHYIGDKYIKYIAIQHR